MRKLAVKSGYSKVIDRYIKRVVLEHLQKTDAEKSIPIIEYRKDLPKLFFSTRKIIAGQVTVNVGPGDNINSTTISSGNVE